MAGMVVFNIRETGNELLRVLEKELRPGSQCILTIDLLIPDVLKGDKDGLSRSILLICRYLDSRSRGTSLKIEISRASPSGEPLNLEIDVKGIYDKRETTQQFEHALRMEVDGLVATFPSLTTVSVSELSICFNFIMPFSDMSETYRETSGKKVLLVEDNDMTALVFISFMEEWEYVVTRVSDGISAVNAAKTQLYDIILMDTSLPKMSGDAAIRNIRKTDPTTPIIALSTSPVDNDFADRYAGASDVLFKPVTSAHLQRILRQYT
jgi:CheY-like chemotaxis protein